MHSVLAVVAGFAAAVSALSTSEGRIARRHADIASHKAKRACTQFPSGPDLHMADIVYDTVLDQTNDVKVMQVVFVTALTESFMNNLDCGDKRSHGLFQQQAPGFTYGSVADTMNPVHSTNAFLRDLMPIYRRNPGWPINQLAQETQQAEAGDQYYRHIDTARNLVNVARGRWEQRNAARLEEERQARERERARQSSISSSKSSVSASRSRASALSRTRSISWQRSITSEIQASITSEIQASITSDIIASQSSEAAESSRSAESASATQTGGPGALNIGGTPNGLGGDNGDSVPAGAGRMVVPGFAALILSVVVALL